MTLNCVNAEINASLFWLEKQGSRFASLDTTVLGDDLYCHEPFCRALLNKQLEFILICKSDSYKTFTNGLMLWSVRVSSKRGCISAGQAGSSDRYVSTVPLRDTDDALLMNGCEITTHAEDSKALYRNAFATSLTIDDNNVTGLNLGL